MTIARAETAMKMRKVAGSSVVALTAVSLVGCSALLQDSNDRAEARKSWPALHTLKEIRDKNVVKQALDYSCGAAALATLLVYYYAEATSEGEILQLLQSTLTPEEQAEKAQRGFSLLDLKKVAQKKGYRAAGFKLTPEQLTRLVAPVIAFVEPQGYKHFAVIRGVQNGMVYLADPARGNLRKRIDQFVLEEWQQGIVFVLGKPGEEKLRIHPLSPSEPFSDVQPQFISVIDMQDQALFTRSLPMR